MPILNLTPIELYNRGIYTLDEIIEMVPDLDPDWIEEQLQLIEANHIRFWMADTKYARKYNEGL